MGTRGFVGFAVDGTEKIAYNHFDSYPSGLGLAVLSWAREIAGDLRLEDAKRHVRALRVVEADSAPTEDDVNQLRPFYNPNVGGPSERPTWYQLLRETQGDPDTILRAGVIEDASEFPQDSLFAEWGYVVDLDELRLEVYEGFQEEPHVSGRFSTRAGRDGYHPVKLARYWRLDALPTNAEFITALEPTEDES